MKPSILVEIPQEENKSYPIYIDKEPIRDLAKKLNELTSDKKRLIIF